MSDEMPTVAEQTAKVLDQARASGHLTPLDEAAARVLLRLAEKIDMQTETGLTPDGKLDNVTEPMFLKYLNTLGLTPESRAQIQKIVSQSGAGGASKPDGKSKVARFSAAVSS